MIKPFKVLGTRETEAGIYVDYECKYSEPTETGVKKLSVRSSFKLEPNEDPEQAVEALLRETGWINA